MPFADVIGGIARLSKSVSERLGLQRESDTIAPDTMPISVGAGKQTSSGRRADRLIRNRVRKVNAFAGDSVQMGVRLKRVQPVRPRQSHRNWSEMIRITFGRSRSNAALRCSGVAMGITPPADERFRKSRRVTGPVTECSGESSWARPLILLSDLIAAW